MKYILLAGLLAMAGVNCAKTSFVLPEDGSESVEHLRRVPQGWNEVGAPSENMMMHFRIAVRSVSVLDESTLDTQSFPLILLEQAKIRISLESRAMTAYANAGRPTVLCWSESSWMFRHQAHHTMVNICSATS
tara:strand:- start:7900 stop:8298 length:399 start_codon:yes stop_codon:yes gene_type:complete